MYFTTHQAFRRSVGRWRHNFCKFAVEIFQNVENRRKSSCQILPLATVDIVINSTDGASSCLTSAGMHCPAWDDAFGF